MRFGGDLTQGVNGNTSVLCESLPACWEPPRARTSISSTSCRDGCHNGEDPQIIPPFPSCRPPVALSLTRGKQGEQGHGTEPSQRLNVRAGSVAGQLSLSMPQLPHLPNGDNSLYHMKSSEG